MTRGARVWRVVLLALLALACGLALTFTWLIYVDSAYPAAAVDAIVPEGSSVAAIAHQLEAQGIVRDPTLLEIYIRVRGGGEHIQAAEYEFPAHETIRQVAQRLAQGGRPPTVWVTIPEGFTAVQIARKLSLAKLVSEGAFELVARGRSLAFGSAHTVGLEGYLFPDTYEIRRQASADDIAAMMTKQFLGELPRGYEMAARRVRLSIPQIVTIASMIEREGKVDVERPLIASVIYNRLARGMPLEIDATIEYALPHHKTALSFADLAIDSPYNTYIHAGLPPTPICNPGKASLYAAFRPAATPYLYYVYKGNGRHVFSQTLEEQQQNIRRYLH